MTDYPQYGYTILVTDSSNRYGEYTISLFDSIPAKINEAKIAKPLVEVLNNPITSSVPEKAPQKKLSEALNELFPEQQYDEKKIQKAKEILGALAAELTPSRLQDAVCEIEYLCEFWLDDFERQTFGGLTLKEFLHEKGGK